MKDLEAHADAILRAAGSSLKNYTLNGTREAILAAVRDAMGEWQPIETAPKDRYFLACVTPERSEEKLMEAIFGSDRPKLDRRHTIVASIRHKQRKGRVHMSVTGQPFWATHWRPLPLLPPSP